MSRKQEQNMTWNRRCTSPEDRYHQVNHYILEMNNKLVSTFARATKEKKVSNEDRLLDYRVQDIQEIHKRIKRFLPELTEERLQDTRDSLGWFFEQDLMDYITSGNLQLFLIGYQLIINRGYTIEKVQTHGRNREHLINNQ